MASSLRIIKYVKPYLGAIIIAIVLLFGQAYFELSLPNYLSDIVNTGIQQGGVENAVPVAIRQQEMDRVLIFINENETKLTILNSYSLITINSTDYNQYLELYPLLANESVYTRNTIDSSTIERLNRVMAQGILIVQFIKQIMTDSVKAAQLGINTTDIPPGTDIFLVLSKMSAPQLAQIIARFDSQFKALGDKMVIQAAIVVIKTEYVALGMNTDRLQNDYIIRIGILMLFITLLSMACTIGVSYISAKVSSEIARDLRKDVFTRVEDFSLAEFDKFSTASLITRSTNDITQIQMVIIMMIRMVFFAPIMGFGGIILAYGKAPSMSWIIVLAVTLLLSLILTIVAIALPKFKRIQQLVDRLNLVSRENLSGILVIRAFNKQKFEEQRFDKANADLTTVSLFINRLMAVMMPLMMLIMNGLTIIIVWVGAHEVAGLNIQVGDMMAFMQYTMHIVFSFLMMSIMLIILPRASVSAVRIMEVLNTDSTIKDINNPKRFSDSFTGRIEFHNVSFHYPNAEKDVLTDISFIAEPGKTTAFIGATGAGKTTLINLIPRFYEVTKGSILIDGVDIREVTQHDLRTKIGYIAQKSILFSGTIKSNLLYGDEYATADTLNSAITISQATDFVTTTAEGIESAISQGGTNVSGGQKQRLSIARALVKRPPIYLFDDSFSALDFKTDAALRKALKAKTGQSTILIVTQRVSTILSAEQIIVLDKGKIIDKGTHNELMKRCETYKEIVFSQLELEGLP